jgi:hypothetical protein
VVSLRSFSLLPSFGCELVKRYLTRLADTNLLYVKVHHGETKDFLNPYDVGFENDRNQMATSRRVPRRKCKVSQNHLADHTSWMGILVRCILRREHLGGDRPLPLTEQRAISLNLCQSSGSNRGSPWWCKFIVKSGQMP